MDALTRTEELALGDYELIIERGQTAFVEVAAALSAIRAKRLYRATHGTFEAYCQERWRWSASRSRQIIGASEVVAQVQVESVTSGNAPTPTPTNERQARALKAVPEAERPEVWRKAVDDADGEPVTAERIVRAHREVAAIPELPETSVDPVVEWERAEREIKRLQELVTALESDDTARELVGLSARYKALEGRLAEAIRTKNEAVATATNAQKWLAKIRKEVGVQANGDILDAIRDLRR